jgi:hypothetical protein
MKTKYLILTVIATALQATFGISQVPVFKVTPQQSSIKFYVKSSVALAGDFKKWNAALTFKSTDVTSGALVSRFKQLPWTAGVG